MKKNTLKQNPSPESLHTSKPEDKERLIESSREAYRQHQMSPLDKVLDEAFKLEEQKLLKPSG